MCGIAGLITSALPNHVKRIRIKHMMRLLAHRGPDDEGVFEDSHGCLGHCRLSIIDLSSGGHQPMVDGNHVLVFNGETVSIISVIWLPSGHYLISLTGLILKKSMYIL